MVWTARLHQTHRGIRRSIVSKESQIDPSAKIYRSRLDGEVVIGSRAVLESCTIRANQKVTIDDWSILTGPIRITADLNPVSIGKFSALAPDVAIWEALHDSRRLSSFFVFGEVLGESSFRDLVSKGSIRIGNDCWIGTRSVIVSGVTIGDGAVVGAGSVVTRDVPAYGVVTGVPARLMRYRFSEHVRQRLLELRWWDWDEAKIRRNRELFGDILSDAMLDQVQ